MEDDDEDAEDIYFRVPNSCSCIKRYINFYPNQYLNTRKVSSSEPYVIFRTKRAPKSKFIRVLQRGKRHLTSQPRSDLLQNLFFNLKPLSNSQERQGQLHSNYLAKESSSAARNDLDDEEILMKPLNMNALVPETMAVYILNTPIRFLNQAKQLKDYVYPIMECLPRILRNTNKYFHSFMADLTRKRHRFMGNFVSDLDLIQEIEEPMYEPVYPRFRNRNRRSASPNAQNAQQPFAPEHAKAHENLDDDIHAFLMKPLLRRHPRNISNENFSKLGKESPKLITDEKGSVYVEIKGVKKLLTTKTAFSKEVGVHKLTSIDDLEVKDKISLLIELAKNMSDKQDLKVDITKTEGNILVIKNAITAALDIIQSLVNLDINRDIDICDHVRKLKVLKTNIAREWYYQLSNQRINDIRLKIGLLNQIREMQNMKLEIFMNIARRLQSEDDFNSDTELEILLQLDHLQAVIDKIVDELGAKIQFRGKFDLKTELDFVQDLVNVKLIGERNPTDIGKKVKAKRDEMLEKQTQVLEGLKNILDEKNLQTIDKETAVIQHTGHLQAQRMKLIGQLDGMKMDQTSKIKIIMDLQKQIDFLNEGHVFSKIPKEVTDKKVNSQVDEVKRVDVNKEQAGTNEYEVKLLHQDDSTSSKERFSNNRPKNIIFPVFKFPSRTVSNVIVQERKPVPLVSNGYVLTAYKNEN